MIKKSDTFQCDEHAANHRCFIISDDNSEKHHLVVNMTTLNDTCFYDKSCVLKPSDEPDFIRHDSFIIYEHAFTLPSNFELPNISNISAVTLNKIQNGAKVSKHLPRKFKSFFNLF